MVIKGVVQEEIKDIKRELENLKGMLQGGAVHGQEGYRGVTAKQLTRRRKKMS